jgi:hypothetical protein
LDEWSITGGCSLPGPEELPVSLLLMMEALRCPGGQSSFLMNATALPVLSSINIHSTSAPSRRYAKAAAKGGGSLFDLYIRVSIIVLIQAAFTGRIDLLALNGYFAWLRKLHRIDRMTSMERS